MSSNDRNSRTRFSNRVENYRRYRPGYPEELFEDIIDGFSLIGSPVADIGSGTGIFSRPLLERECSVYGVEPNADMRAAAETWLGDSPGFTSVDGDAGASSLSDDSVSAIFCAQSFHWFDPAAAGREFRRILRPDGPVVLIWNRRRGDTDFGREYDELLLRLCPEYREVGHQRISEQDIRAFLGNFDRLEYPNDQILSYGAFIGRAFSSSYTPIEDSPEGRELQAELLDLFDRYNDGMRIRFEYITETYIGRWQ